MAQKRKSPKLSAAERRRRSIQAKINFGHVTTFRGTTGRKFPISPRKNGSRAEVLGNEWTLKNFIFGKTPIQKALSGPIR